MYPLRTFNDWGHISKITCIFRQNLEIFQENCQSVVKTHFQIKTKTFLSLKLTERRNCSLTCPATSTYTECAATWFNSKLKWWNQKKCSFYKLVQAKQLTLTTAFTLKFILDFGLIINGQKSMEISNSWFEIVKHFRLYFHQTSFNTTRIARHNFHRYTNFCHSNYQSLQAEKFIMIQICNRSMTYTEPF